MGAMNYRRNRAAIGSYDATSAQGREIQGKISEARGNSFEAQVAEIVRRRGDPLKCATRVKKANGKRLRGAGGLDLGDIDVLVANPTRRRLWLRECKDLSPAMTPFRLRSELDNLFIKPDCIDAKHGARVEWARANYRDLLVHLGIRDHRVWKVNGLIVTNRELLGPHFAAGASDVTSVGRLPELNF